MQPFDGHGRGRVDAGLVAPRSVSASTSALLMLGGAAVALAVRYPLLPLESLDFLGGQRLWRDAVDALGFLDAMKQRFDRYPPAYGYLLVAAKSWLDWLPWVVAAKGVSIVFDFLLAFFVYKCVAVRHPRTAWPALGFVATLLAPTVVFNSAMWGQTDAIWAAPLAACLYFLLRNRQGWACAAFGAALAVKPQAIFLAPLLFWLLVRNALNWRYLAWVPGVVIVSMVPALLVGQTLEGLLKIYPRLAGDYGHLTMNAPNLYVWIAGPKGPGYPGYVHWFASGLAALVVLAVAWTVRRSRARLTDELIVLLGTFSVLLMPYILPKMHDRYFFAADAFAIVLAFFAPRRYAYVPLVVVSVSFLAYVPFLLDVGWLVPPELLAAALLAVIVAMGVQGLRALGWQVSPVRAFPHRVRLSGLGLGLGERSSSCEYAQRGDAGEDRKLGGGEL